MPQIKSCAQGPAATAAAAAAALGCRPAVPGLRRPRAELVR